MTDAELLEVLEEAVRAARAALDGVDDWSLSGRRYGQYHLDLACDAAAVPVLERAGLGVLSEESGLHHPERDLWVALDPVDGSMNASRSLPWFATSACVVDADGPRVALVVNQATGERYDAVRGEGARRNGRPVSPTGCATLDRAVVALAGYPRRPLGWQMRSLGAASLGLCAVAAGQLDAFIDFSRNGHGPWDYLAGLLVCREAGAVVVDAVGNELVMRSHEARRSPVAAATTALLREAVAARTARG